ncbi:SDR family oxidoreductase [Salinibacillus xinjiangensis]|uniref:SDR family NAD(P)-dependent oxidoreductase n=1 Tax=Salinibacillus xinjiangensis TaxID=1229268 RepID=A0A6G1XAX4_9BACI|nr:SDR family NAD(P)-dependent oxidoreductase [Salinibacillus xinjiangensis]MRG88134.1 SDR family NAD(P)-dependent oxidoreductase [Salinibacillus xinjiangensis]
MQEKIAVISGAGSGLGASLAKKYSDAGYQIVLTGRNKRRLIQAAKTLNGKYYIYTMDVTSRNEISEVFSSIQKEIGSIELLINNAGLGMFGKAEEIDEKSIHSMIDTNLKGTIFCTQEVLPSMKERDKGVIVNIISTAGLIGKVTESVYCASKFGVRGFTESLYEELKNTNVHVIGAYMGGMKTEFWDDILTDEQTKNFMDPNDIADIIINNTIERKNL